MVKKKPTVALFSTKAKYITLILIAKEIIWLQQLFIKLGFLQPNKQHALIKVSQSNICVPNIQQNLGIACKGEKESGIKNIERIKGEEKPRVILLKGNNQKSITLAHNPVFHIKTKHIDI